jgi:hypothetical protein
LDEPVRAEAATPAHTATMPYIHGKGDGEQDVFCCANYHPHRSFATHRDWRINKFGEARGLCRNSPRRDVLATHHLSLTKLGSAAPSTAQAIRDARDAACKVFIAQTPKPLNGA